MQIDFYEQRAVWFAQVYGEEFYGFSRPHILRLVLERIITVVADEGNLQGELPAELHLSFVWHPIPEEVIA